MVSARKAGLKAATGDYVGFVDGDDFIEPDMYEVMANAAEKYSPDVICSEFYSVFEDKTEVSEQSFEEGYYDRERLKREIYPTILYAGRFYSFGINPNCWSKLFRRTLLDEYLPEVDNRIKMGEDAAFTYPCMLNAKSMYCIKKPLYRYRILSSSMSRGYDKDLESIIYLPYKAICKANEKTDFDISNQLAYYHIYLANFIIRNEAKAKKRDKTFAKRMTSDKELKKSAQAAASATLPMHTRYIVNAIKNGNAFALRLYIKFMSLYLK